MSGINKAIILPILAMVALFVKASTGYEIPNEDLDTIANGILAIISLAGIFMKPKKQA